MSVVSIVAAVGASAVETVGAYAGLASVLGLAVLSLLYFSQAREVRRLREWAGRAPERASELEQRVQTDAQRRVVAQPLAPATIAAQNDAARQAAAAAALYATVGAVPPPGPTVGPPGQLARPAIPTAPVPAAGPAPGLGSLPAAASPASATTPGSIPGFGGSAAPKAPSPAPTPAVSAGASAPSAPVPAPKPTLPTPSTPAAAAAAATAAARQAVVASRTAPPPALSNGGGQDTHESAAARPYPPLPPIRPPEPPDSDDDDGASGFSGARIGAIIGGAVVTILVAIILMVSLTGEDRAPKPNDFGTSAQAAPEDAIVDTPTTPSGVAGTQRVDRRSVKVAVLNGTSQTGLARGVADTLEQGGFTIGTVGNNADQQVPQTIVSFKDGSERAAQTVAGLIKVDRSSVQPIDTNTSVAADADVVVTVGTDQIG